MITQEHEFYIRYILLLLQVGTQLLRRIAETALQRNKSDLRNLLTSAESTIMRDKHLSRSQKETLYPCPPQEARIEDCDITLLSYLITNHLKSYIYSNELYAVNAIREMRNDHAHVSGAKMIFPVFNTKWTELVGIINTGVSGLSLEEQKSIKTTTMSIAGDPIDIKTVVEELKRLDESKVFFETIQNSLYDIQKSQEQLVEAVSNVGKAQQRMSGDVSNVKDAQKSDDMDISTKHVAQSLPYSGKMIEFSKVQAIRNPDTKLPPDFDILQSRLRGARIALFGGIDRSTMNACLKALRDIYETENIIRMESNFGLRILTDEVVSSISSLELLTEIVPSEFIWRDFGDPPMKKITTLWFMSQDLLKNERMVHAFECFSTPKVPILFQKCEIPERLKKIVFLDVSEEKKEDLPNTVAQASLLYDHWKLRWVIQQFKAEPDLKQIMQEDKDFGSVYKDLLNTGGINSMELLSEEYDWLDKLKVCLKYAHLADDIVDDVEKNLRIKQEWERMDNEEKTVARKAENYWMLKGVIQQCEAEPDLKRIMQEDKDFGSVYKDLLNTGGINKYAHLADDIVDDVEENLRTKQEWERMDKEKTVARKAERDWDGCVRKRDLIGILDLLQTGRYPNENQLRMLCEFLGRKHPLTKIVCVKISDFIREQIPQLSSENIIKPVYEEKDENEIIFLIDESNDDNTKKINVDKINFTIELRNLKAPNSENEHVIQYELEDNEKVDYKKMDEMEKYIEVYSESLCKEHSNIIMITASPVKSTGYKNGKFATEERKHSIKKQYCIVLFVPAKGLIPLQEDCFPKTLGSFETDVREGYFELLVGGGPRDRHQTLKMGCAIGIQSESRYGTLGGFVDHPTYGLCAVTCAHVVLTVEEMNVLRDEEKKVLRDEEKKVLTDEEKKEKKNPINFRRKTIVQPHMGDEFGIVEKEMFKYLSGKDAALIQITQQNRQPIDGHFPDCTEEERTSAGCDGIEEMLYRSGKILKLDNTNRDQYEDFPLVKFGATTSIRRGSLQSIGISVFEFKNQIQIYPFNKQIFAEEGDSGSFVFFVTHEKEFLLIGMLIGNGPGFWVVTPITDVLAALDCDAKFIKIFYRQRNHLLTE